ncbi:Asp-tRNA(Asn)/Glu-tRNA(Gln) amidotransferase subunit GatB [Mycoplasma phocoenae]|uniref:Aspartyl/glutamyl-tRNA(Asn/Gln) amidotransferase subunit B n=1 Tax=Mycoplasma phocoenae TaxID=754517 RepID=A0A858U4M4_9MOLU|nr:Asp-tRNA(Asn)/Glu-tRNA(Gln) amidotransferase subunit GatB [Mycoplasma phocoenae]QJG66991.1 Asp-tRNA(Asn)/Glu-tRNA(Gln) amidotransferase subunit GatB [Mycoplasma phocoenae]
MFKKDWEPVIGIEIHLELNTKTKMFSSAPNVFSLEPNKGVNVIDLAYPGTLPLLNKQAVIFGIKLAKALKMKVDNELHFDRKNYFYTDLPKGYQITQQFRPIGSDGVLPIEINNKIKNIDIERIHLEEDTAKQIHEGDTTFINYNRAGVPLIEIVSKPVIKSAKEAVEYINNIRLIALSLGISDAKMSEGSLRADVNISVREKGTEQFNTRVEIKNLNSLSNVEKAIEYEMQWQIEQHEKGIEFEQQTKRFDEASQTNKMMRSKSSAVDYKYFPEPNIPIIQLTDELINSVNVDELPWERKQRYIENNLNNVQYEQLIQNMEYANFIDRLCNISNISLKKITNIFFSQIVSFLNEKSIQISELPLSYEEFVFIIEQMEENKLLKHSLNVIMNSRMLEENINIEEIIKSNDLKAKDLSLEITSMINEILNSNKDLMEEYTTRPDRVVKFVVGQVMKLSKGQANPVQTKEILLKALEK